ncbi:hypothetical protein BC938DRAFT_476177 [Jimgerdemannia flammicorona]|uniref:Centrosomin N-terminal motif 1 domain-containing protein n=1 Tax=Jimgerdemannia flammicorona TaxID=994334 RepID=A0A433PJI5_9FUNG|nr:hypothetical protein BC938DRAFT_476177 [Jimgerdemannia flammicorona]
MTDKHARQQEDTSFAFSQDASFNFLDQNNVSMLNRSMGSIHSPSLTKRSGHHLGSQTAGGSGSLTNGLNNAGGDYDDDYFFDQSEDSKLKFDFDALNDEDPNDTMTSLPGDRKGISTTSAMGNRGINGRGSVPNKNARSTTEKDKDKKTNMTLKEQEKVETFASDINALTPYLDYRRAEKGQFWVETENILLGGTISAAFARSSRRGTERGRVNFNMLCRVVFEDQVLHILSNIDRRMGAVLQQNIDLKVKIQTLVQEVKKYKKMILELQSAMEILREKGSCDLPHGMSEDQQEEYERAMASAKESKQESDHLHQKLAELSSEMTRLRDLLRNQKAKEFGILSEDEKEYLVQEKNRAISETEKYRQELQQAKSMIEEQTRTIRHLRDQGMMAPSNDVLQTILIERDNALAQADLMANHVSEMRGALTTQTEINRALQHDRDMAKAEAEQLAKSVLELGQQEMVLNMELDRVATMSERNAQGLQDSVRMKQESDTSMISREKLEEEREMIKKLSDVSSAPDLEIIYRDSLLLLGSLNTTQHDTPYLLPTTQQDIASYKSQVSAQQTLIQNHENENGQLLDELELLKAREARLSQMLGIDPDDEEEMQLREKMEEDGVRSEFEILAWKSERVEAVCIAQLRDRNAELTIQLREKESEIDQLQAEIEDILEVTESKARDIQRLREVNAGLKEDLQHLRQENDALVPQLEEANRALREEELAHQEDVARMDSELDARERECASLENELEKVRL